MTRAMEAFTPIKPGEVGIYCCGPTVYNFQHIGNLKTYVFEDVLVRTLRYAGYKVKHVMNITDVGHLVSDGDEGEDKMLVAMRREGKTSHDIAEYYTQIFFDDSKALHIKRPDIVCKATDHIQEMIELIKRIEEAGYAYLANGNVYFDVAKFKSYGKLALLDLEKLKAGARIEVDQHKRSPFDFVLWFTKSKFENQELQWESPWGRGYPGWHIECSAMSIKYLGEQFDIHCGGIDHIPVHHTNEIAQTEAATGKPWVNVWMHSDFILFGKAKMSKSTGGFIVLKDAIERGIDPLAYRLFCLSGHYRSQLSFSWETLENTDISLKKLKSSILNLKSASEGKIEKNLTDSALKYRDEFREALFNDLNTAKGLALVWSVVGDASLSASVKLALLFEMDSVLGLGMEEWQEIATDVPTEIMDLVNQRNAARAAKNWAESDRIRAEISARGFTIEDSAQGVKVKRS